MNNLPSSVSGADLDWIADWQIEPPRATHKSGFWCKRNEHHRPNGTVEETLEISSPEGFEDALKQAIKLWEMGRLG